MKLSVRMCLLVLTMSYVALAQQDPTKPVLRPGVSVEMPVSNQAVEMREADNEDATVVAVTADGSLFEGNRPVELSELGKVYADTVYVKADARVPYQKILAVLDALRGRSVVLLTSSPSNSANTGIAPPYGVKVALGH